MFRQKQEQTEYHQLVDEKSNTFPVQDAQLLVKQINTAINEKIAQRDDAKNEEKAPQKSSFSKICTKIGAFVGAAKVLYTMPAYVIYNGVKRIMDERRLSVEQDGLLDYMYNKCLPVVFWCSPNDSLDCCPQSSFLSCNLDGQSNPCSDVFDAFKICDSEKALRFSAICSSVYNPTGYWIIGSGVVLTIVATAGLVACYQWDKKNNGTEGKKRLDILEQPFSTVMPAQKNAEFGEVLKQAGVIDISDISTGAVLKKLESAIAEAKPSLFGKCKSFLSCSLFKAKTPSISRETPTQDLTRSASLGASMV